MLRLIRAAKRASHGILRQGFKIVPASGVYAAALSAGERPRHPAPDPARFPYG
ncbi:hypothetical protein NGB36_00265 [Streptomyces sp. RB6PN25]|uniref:Uncharacterized protein n=1 Tax=Streptomyces humicola TaxID=2953240 RepID=A0ABT1PQ87_9ACTN|nr:hypothetical protein [Streptomyces humicola]MCQ4079090.1 hypothetical protein [Streptomyces humicola]